MSDSPLLNPNAVVCVPLTTDGTVKCVVATLTARERIEIVDAIRAATNMTQQYDACLKAIGLAIVDILGLKTQEGVPVEPRKVQTARGMRVDPKWCDESLKPNIVFLMADKAAEANSLNDEQQKNSSEQSGSVTTSQS